MVRGTRGLVFGARSGSETRGLSPWHRVQLSAVIPDGSMMVPVFWGEYSKGVSPSSCQRGRKETDNWDVQGQGPY